MTTSRAASVLLPAVLLLTGVLAVGCDDGKQPGAATPVGPASTSAGTPSASHPAHPSAHTRTQRQLVQLAIGPREGRASVWRSCGSERCAKPSYTIRTSADAFRTAHSVALPDHQVLDLVPAGAAGFVVRRGYRVAWLLYFDGTLRRILERGPTRAAEPGEVVVESGRGVHAVDTDTAVAHRVPTPAYLHDVTMLRGRLHGITYPPDGRSAFAVSVNGGGVWGFGSLPVRHALWMPVTGGRVPAFIQGSDGATLFPFLATWRYRSGTFHRSPAPTDPTGYVSCAHRLRDGRLLVCVDAWSDQRRSKVPTAPGFWVSTDTSWRDFEHVEPGAPFDDDVAFQPVVVGERATASGLLLVVADPDTGLAWATRDLGHTFTRVRAR